MSKKRFGTLCAAAALLAGAAERRSAAGEWLHWRGASMNGVAADEGLATEWSPTENVLWRQPMPGPAGSTPVVSGGRIFLTAASDGELALCAYEAATGAPLWRRTVSRGSATFLGDEGNLASPSPSTDGQRIVAVMGDGRMACYDTDGVPCWRVDLNERLGELSIQFGYSSTPIVHEGRVYLQWIHGDGDSKTREARVACLDLATGETVWSSERPTGARAECEHAYASPILVGDGAGKVLVTHGADFCVAYDPDNGEEIWRLGGLNYMANYHSTLRFVSTPAAGDGLLVVPTAKKGAVVAVSLGGRGNLTGSRRERWRLQAGTPDVPSPLVHDGLVYLCGENGNLTCLEAKTGERVYRKRTIADRHRASPLLADGKIYLTSRRGKVSVIRAGREFELLAQNDLGEPMSSSPIAVDGVLYLRTFEALYAIKDAPAAGEGG